MSERIALLIDGENLHSAARSLGFEIDFQRLRKEFEAFGTIVRAFFYTRVNDDDAFNNVKPLIDWLDYNGFTVKTRPVKEHDDGEGRRRLKRIGVHMAVDALEIARHVNHIFLFSGDGDFRRLVESLQRSGLRVTVVSSLRTTPPMVSDELRRQANDFIEINTIRRSIERSPATHRPRMTERTELIVRSSTPTRKVDTSAGRH